MFTEQQINFSHVLLEKLEYLEAYLFLTPVLPSPRGGGDWVVFFRVSDWLLGWTPSPSPRRVGQGSGAGKFFGLLLDKKFKNYDTKWLFMDVLPKLEHIEFT